MAGNYSLGVAQGTIIIAYDGKGVKAAQAGLAGVEARSKSTMATVGKVGRTMTKTGLIMAAGLGVAIKTAVDFQQKMNLLVTAAGESPKAIGAVAKGLQDIAIKTGTSLSQMADGMYLAEKAGYRAGAGLKVMAAAAEGARAENVDLGTFTSALTSIMTSYSYKADDAVAVTNMLVRAAGASKTTMQEFAGSLASVLPIASALHISFPQVAGAISVLTQHGTSAAEATQELANLIRNLAGQNNVAKASLEQLGVKVIDLQKNMGRRGLTGTLEIVTRALEHHGKAGMIVTDALKQSATAEQAMHTMLGRMHPQLQKVSKELLTGHTNIYEYRKETRKMAGTAGVMGMQFLSLFENSKGFSNALRSGNPRVATLAQTLQKALGGATGLRTALQLGVSTSKDASASHTLLTKNVKAIGDAGRHSGKDIETWAATSETAAVKLGRLKAAGEVFGVMMGNIVLPAVTKVVGALVHFLGWLINLPGPMKKFLGYGTLLAASLLLLGGLFIKLVEFGTKFYKAMVLVGKGVSGTVRAVQNLLIKLGILPSAQERATQAAQIAAGEQEAAEARVATAYEEAVARIEAAQANLDAAYAAQAEAANGSATEQENAALRVRYAQEGMAVASVRAEEQVAAAEMAAAEAAQRAAALTSEAMAAQTRAVQAGAAEQEAALGGLAGSRAVSGAAGGVGGAGGGRRMSGLGLGLGTAAFFGGSMLKSGHSSTSVQGMVGTPLELAGAGAAIGSFAGPVGAAVGAGIGGIVGGLKDWWEWDHKVNDAQKQLNTVLGDSAQNMQDMAKSYTVAGKAGAGAKEAAAAAALAHTDLVKKAQDAGLTEKDLTLAITGSNEQFDRTVALWKSMGNPAQHTIDALTELHNQFIGAGEAARQNALITGEALPGWRRTGTSIDLVSGKLVRLIGRWSTAKGTGADFRSSLEQISKAAQTNGTVLDQDSSFGRQNAAVLRGAAAAALAHAQAVYVLTSRTKGHRAAVQASLSVLANDRQRLINAADAAGYNKDQVQHLINHLYTLNQQHPHVKIHINTEQAQTDLSNFNDWFTGYLAMMSSHAVVHVRTSSGNGVSAPGLIGAKPAPGPGKSIGGWIPGSSSTVWQGAVHGKEYVLSRNMLQGKQAVDASVLNALSIGQRRAMASRGPLASALNAAPRNLTLRPQEAGPRRHRVAGGRVEIGADSQGNLRAWVQDLITEEHDFRTELTGMAR